MYKISFTDRTVILVDTPTGDNVKAMQMESPAPNYFEIGKDVYKLDKVSKIEWQPDQPTYKALPEPPRCHAQKSIHLVIYEEYKKRLRAGKRESWKEFCKRTYDYIYEQKPNAKFCDYKKGTCFCERSAVERVQEVIPGAVEI